MIIKTLGVILRTLKYSETSVIADIYTEEKGLRSYILSGVRSKNAKVSPGLIQVTSLVEMVAYDREEASLLRIKEIKSAYTYQSLPFDVPKSAVGMFIIELARKTLKESEENRPLFRLIFDMLVFLDQTTEPYANLPLSFMLALAAFLGFQPHGGDAQEGACLDLKEGVFTTAPPGHAYYLLPDLAKYILRLLRLDWRQSHQVAISRADRQTLTVELLTLYRLHIDNFPVINSHLVFREVL